MALWQYTFQVLTKESFDSLHKDIGFSIEDYCFDDEPYWQYKPVDRSLFAGLQPILKKGQSWSNEIDLYGNEELNCFEVLFNKQNDNILSASFRIDFTSDYENVLIQIIEFCISNGLVILDENLNVVPLDIHTVKHIIENAPQISKYNELKNKANSNQSNTK